MIADGTQTYSESRKLDEGCLESHYNKDTAEETVNCGCADSLYASEPMMENGWEFIIRYKPRRIPSITEEYEKIPEKEASGQPEFINDIDHNRKPVNMLRFWEEKAVRGEMVRTDLQWPTSIGITKKSAGKPASHTL